MDAELTATTADMPVFSPKCKKNKASIIMNRDAGIMEILTNNVENRRCKKKIVDSGALTRGRLA